jgi:hypothetical protein
MLNYFDAHDPYIAPPPFDRHLPQTEFERLMVRHWWAFDKADLPAEQLAFLRAAYDDCLRHLDSQIGQLLDRLDADGRLHNTVVIITADHGEHFGDHGLLLHGNSLYQALIHVPLIVIGSQRGTALPSRANGSGEPFCEIPANRRVSAAVSLADLPASVLEFVAPGARSPFAGGTWSRSWQERDRGGWGRADREPPARAAIFSEALGPEPGCPPCQGRSPVFRGEMRCVIRDGFKLIRNGDGAEELYDLNADPDERYNLCDDPDYKALRTELQGVLMGYGA